MAIVQWFDPDTGSLVISNMSNDVQIELQRLILNRTRDSMATSNPAMDTTLARVSLRWSGLKNKVPHCLLALYPYGHNGTPSLIVSCRAASGKRGEWAAKRSKNTHIMTERPKIQTMIRLDFRGLTSAPFIDVSDCEHHMKRIADLSEVVTWTRNKDGKIDGSVEKLSKENGELCLCILGGGNNEATVVGKGTKVVIKYKEILDAVRSSGGWGPLGAIPRYPPTSGMEASVLPLFSFHRRLDAIGSRINNFPGSDMLARAARLPNSSVATPTSTVLAAPLGPTRAAVQSRLGGANPNLLGHRVWGTGAQLLRRLLRR